MRNKLNCPNCGAPITSAECPYCGSVFYDFATLDSTKPTYIRIKWNDQIITTRVLMRGMTITNDPDALATMEIGFAVVPGEDGTIFKQERITDDC